MLDILLVRATAGDRAPIAALDNDEPSDRVLVIDALEVAWRVSLSQGHIALPRR